MQTQCCQKCGIYANNSKWLSVQIESTVWTNTVPANQNKPVSQILFADAGPGLGKFMDGLYPE